jgi:Tfp pilus assembly protein PilF
MSMIKNLERMLATGHDSPLLRFSLGTEYLKQGQPEQALEHLEEAVSLDPNYSAAWKAYGKALTAVDRAEEAIAVYERGIAAAEDRGDVQAVKEMRVFLKRLRKDSGA